MSWSEPEAMLHYGKGSKDTCLAKNFSWVLAYFLGAIYMKVLDHSIYIIIFIIHIYVYM